MLALILNVPPSRCSVTGWQPSNAIAVQPRRRVSIRVTCRAVQNDIESVCAFRLRVGNRNREGGWVCGVSRGGLDSPADAKARSFEMFCCHDKKNANSTAKIKMKRVHTAQVLCAGHTKTRTAPAINTQPP